MDTSHIDTAVIGAGAAGLIAGRLLQDRGTDFAIFDEHARVGDAWRERYRSLRLFTPRRWGSLPGAQPDIGFFAFPTGAQMTDYLEGYAERFDLPVHASSPVTRLRHDDAGRFTLTVGDGEEVTADHVIVAAGAHRRAVVPPFAADLDPDVTQVTSIDYRGPEDLAPGPVLVVGAGNSGTDIALEAAAAGHATAIAGRHPGQIPFDIDTPIGNLMSGLVLRMLRATTLGSARGRAMIEAHRDHGLNLIRNKVKDLDAAGVRRVGRVERVENRMPVLADGERLTPATVVWCTGSVPILDWIEIPGVHTGGQVHHWIAPTDAGSSSGCRENHRCVALHLVCRPASVGTKQHETKNGEEP